MGKKILYILLGALIVFGLLYVLWAWLFGGASNKPANNGAFGSAGNVTQTTGSNGATGNGQVPLGSDTNQTQNIGGSGNGTGGTGGSDGSSGGGTGGGITGSDGGSSTAGTSGGSSGSLGNAGSVEGVDFLPTTGGVLNANGFTPISINGVANGFVGGSVPTVGGSIGSAGGGSGNNTNFLLGAGIAGLVSCGIRAAAITAAGTSATAASTASTATAPASVQVFSPSFPFIAGGSAAQTSLQTGDQSTSFAACILNTLAKAALAQITASVVNWVNGGFNGSPSFITNYKQFFNNVADVAAGQFIQGAGLSFLCSPFQLQIKIAIAQSYANRNAQSCTLSRVIGNVNSFMNGNFAQGGWGGLLSYTSVPTNNPYGAYSYGQIGLSNAQQSALATANRSVSPTGFIGLQQQTCNGQSSVAPTGGLFSSQAAQAGGSCPSNCKCRVTTPGSVIESSLNKTLGSGIDQLGLANSLDQIINALVNQLMVRTLYGGLSNLSGISGYQNTFQSPSDQAAQQTAQGLLADMQNKVVLEEQLGAIAQGSIADIQGAQAQLNNLLNCWNSAAASPSLSSAQVGQAATNASTTNALLLSLNVRAIQFNNKISQINNQIGTLQQLQTEALSVGSSADVQMLQNDYAAAQATAPFATATDVTTAQQNRTALQSEMSAQNAQTQTALAQCNALQ